MPLAQLDSMAYCNRLALAIGIALISAGLTSRNVSILRRSCAAVVRNQMAAQPPVVPFVFEARFYAPALTANCLYQEPLGRIDPLGPQRDPANSTSSLVRDRPLGHSMLTICH